MTMLLGLALFLSTLANVALVYTLLREQRRRLTRSLLQQPAIGSTPLPRTNQYGELED